MGGQIFTIIKGLPEGLGEPVFHKLQSAIAHSIMNINTCKGIEFGLGFDYAKKRGSQGNDPIFLDKNKTLKTKTNNAGGILGGISNGQDVYFRTAFKPVSTIFKTQQTCSRYLCW